MRAFRIIESLRSVANSFAGVKDPEPLHPGDIFPSLKDIKWNDGEGDTDDDPQLALEQLYQTLSAFSR